MIDHGLTHEQIDQEFTCDHVQSCITYLITRAGTKLFRRQCLRCGQQVAVLRKGDLTQAQMDAAIPHDEALQPAWWRQKNERHRALRDQVETQRADAVAREVEEREREQARADAAWRARYNAHLLSPKWHRLRALVIKRCDGICEGCAERPVAHIHHLSYEHMGDEFLFELAGVCIPCHHRLHPGKFSDYNVKAPPLPGQEHRR